MRSFIPVVVVIAVLVVGVVVTMRGLSASGGGDQAFGRATPTATKGPSTDAAARVTPGPPPMMPVQSCPEDVGAQTFIKPYTNVGDKSAVYFTNEARLFSAPGQPTWIQAGAIATDREQGVLFVQDEQLDPCAAALNSTLRHQTIVDLTPAKWGPVTLMAINGTSVEFSSEGGVTGSFDVVSHEFTVGGVVETPLPIPTQPPAQTLEPTPTLVTEPEPALVVAPGASR
jgi:hypothetical protein